MRRLEASLPGGRVLLALDVGLVVWTVLWIAIAIAISVEVRDLAELSDTVTTVGEAAEASGTALGLLVDVPVVGDSLGGTLAEPAERIKEAGRSAQEGGAASRESVDSLSVLLALAIALIPSTPLLAIYLPARVGRVREAKAIDRARRRAGADPAFQEFLARRAAQNLSVRRLERLVADPWEDLEAGRFDRLARAELGRLGLAGLPDR